MLIDCIFQNNLKDMKIILRPLNKVQHQLKLDNKSIEFVILKQIKIKNKLKHLYKIKKFLQLILIISLIRELFEQFE